MTRKLPTADGADSEWAIVGQGVDLLVGPRRAFPPEADLRASVRIDPSLTSRELGAVQRTIEVAESGLRSFAVTWQDGESGEVVAVNPAGGNRVAWRDPTHVSLAPVDNGHLTAVHVRFLLRHLSTQVLAGDLGARPLHAVTGTLLAGPSKGRALAIAGATQSGKTRLANRLTAVAVLDEVTDDDCPLLTSEGRLVTLLPRRYEVARVHQAVLGALVLLSDTAETVSRVDSQAALELLLGMPLPWPAGWLPAVELPGLAELPDVPLVLAPRRDESCAYAVSELLGATQSMRS